MRPADAIAIQARTLADLENDCLALAYNLFEKYDEIHLMMLEKSLFFLPKVYW